MGGPYGTCVCMYDAGLPHPPSPPTPWYPPLPVKWGVVLFGLVAFPVWFCLASSPPPLWSGGVLYRGMVWLLPLVGSNVIVTCLVPSPMGPVVVLVGPAPPVWGSVFYRDMVWLLVVAVLSSLRARYHTKYDVALFLLANGAPVPALMRFSAPLKKHWLGSFSIVLPPSGLRGFVPVVRDRREQGRPWGPGGGDTMGGGGGGGWGPGTREHVNQSVGSYITIKILVRNDARVKHAHPSLPGGEDRASAGGGRPSNSKIRNLNSTYPDPTEKRKLFLYALHLENPQNPNPRLEELLFLKSRTPEGIDSHLFLDVEFRRGSSKSLGRQGSKSEQ